MKLEIQEQSNLYINILKKKNTKKAMKLQIFQK